MTDDGEYPTGPGGMSAQWRHYALHLRTVLEQVGVHLTACLPGETEECGHDYATHCVNYLAALQAKAEEGLKHLHHGDQVGEDMARELLGHWRGVFSHTECARGDLDGRLVETGSSRPTHDHLARSRDERPVL